MEVADLKAKYKLELELRLENYEERIFCLKIEYYEIKDLLKLYPELEIVLDNCASDVFKEYLTLDARCTLIKRIISKLLY